MKPKQKLKKILIVQHRRERYHAAIQKYIDGKVPYTYVEERWKKLQEVQ